MVSSSTKNKENQHWEVALPRFLQSVTSQVMVSPCLRKCQNTHENSRTMAKDSSIQQICHGCCPPPIPRLVSSWQRPSDLLVNVTATNDTPCLMLCHVERVVLRKQWKHRPQFSNHLLSDYFLLSTCPLLNACFLAVSCYKLMCLTTSAYGTT